MEIKEIEDFLVKLELDMLPSYLEMYQVRLERLVLNFWTLEEINKELSYTVPGSLEFYFEELGMEGRYKDKIEHNVQLDTTLFKRFFGVNEIEDLLDGLVEFELSGKEEAITDYVSFDMDGYCEYYHHLLIRNENLDFFLN